MKKFFAVLIAATVLAAPLAQAQTSRPAPPRAEQQFNKKPVAPKPVAKKWRKGEKVQAAQRRSVVSERDYRRYKLAAPRRGQQWVQVDGQFLLVNAVSGLILGLAAAR